MSQQRTRVHAFALGRPLVALVIERTGGIAERVRVDLTPAEARELAAQLVLGAGEIDRARAVGLLRNRVAQARLRRVREDHFGQ